MGTEWEYLLSSGRCPEQDGLPLLYGCGPVPSGSFFFYFNAVHRRYFMLLLFFGCNRIIYFRHSFLSFILMVYQKSTTKMIFF